MNPKHPDLNSMRDYSIGALPEDRAQQFDEHLAECPHCERTLAEMRTDGDTIIEALRSPRATDPVFGEPELHIALDRVMAQAEPPTEVAASDATDVNFGDSVGRIGGYRLLERLGQGGMGEVYKALHVKLKKVVALKTLSADYLRDPHAVARFEREMHAVGRMDHPHVVRAIDAGEADGKHFLVMEFVDGWDLAEISRRLGPLPVPEACELIRQAASGLQAAHERGLIHRDVKPANLMLSRPRSSDDRPTVKILDMGLAQLSDLQGRRAGELTRPGQIVGTVDYMAPEQAGSSRAVDVRADLYSLGATLFRLLTGRTIFSSRPNGSVLEKLTLLATQPAPAIQSLRTDLPDALGELTLRLLSKDPDQRPSTPREVIDALELFAAGADLESLIRMLELRPAESVESHVRPEGPESSQTAAATVDRPVRNAGVFRRPWIAAAAIAATVVLAAVAFFVQTDHGILLVTVDDPDGAITVAVEGADVVVADRDGPVAPVRLRAGDHALRVSRGDLVFESQSFTMKRGETVAVSVRLVPGEIRVERDGAILGSGRLDLGETPADAVGPSYAAGLPLWRPDPEQQRFLDDVAKLSPQIQLVVVKEKLAELNPGFDSRADHRTVSHKTVDDAVVVFSMNSDHVTEIWPVRALTGLREFICRGADPRSGKLTDLSPLAGLPLTSVRVHFTQVSDLSPLKGMPLKSLDIQATNVNDLSPLAGMKLTNLDCQATSVADLSPLTGMPLTSLNIHLTNVNDLSPLAGMQLTNLDCRVTSVTDLSPLAGMPLKSLNLVGCASLSDLSPLRGLPLRLLHLAGTNVEDLTPLAGMPLTDVGVDDTLVKDLTPLRRLALTHLGCNKTAVSDLRPIRGIPMAAFGADVGLFDESRVRILRSLPTVVNFSSEHRGYLSVEEFWADHARRRSAAEEFAAATAKLPPEEQEAAVRSKLTELNKGQFGGAITISATIEEGAVVEASVRVKDNASDVSPLRAFTGLKRLTILEGPRWLDLSPLLAAPLEELNCRDDILHRNLHLFVEMKSLKTINGEPVAERLEELVGAASRSRQVVQ